MTWRPAFPLPPVNTILLPPDVILASMQLCRCQFGVPFRVGQVDDLATNTRSDFMLLLIGIAGLNKSDCDLPL
jgi:hypothetical protein